MAQIFTTVKKGFDHYTFKPPISMKELYKCPYYWDELVYQNEAEAILSENKTEGSYMLIYGKKIRTFKMAIVDNGVVRFLELFSPMTVYALNPDSNHHSRLLAWGLKVKMHLVV